MKMNSKTENYEFSFNEGNEWYLQLWKKISEANSSFHVQ